MKKLIFAILILALAISCQKERPVIADKVTPTKESNAVVIGEIDSIHSAILDENRKYWIHLPKSTTDETYTSMTYPVLYLLDGPGHFHSVTGMIKQLSTENGNMVVPEMIVVAIPNTDRTRDLTPTPMTTDFFTGDSIPYPTGGGNKFLDFMEKELIPHIEKNYPVTSNRTFVGHSFGGLSVINALINRQHLFSNYVAIDPSFWWDNQAYAKTADSLLSTQQFQGKSLYVGIANTMKEGMTIEEVHKDTTKATAHIRSILAFSKALEKKDNGLSFRWKYYGDDDHGSVPLITEYDALRFLFKWYGLKDVHRFFDPKRNYTKDEVLQILNTHYNTVSEHMGYRVHPPEKLVSGMGYWSLHNNMPKKAAALFDMNIQNYPNSYDAYDCKGDYFLAQKDTIKALELFSKALEYGERDYIQEKVDQLKSIKE